jgi:hypothetical protein
MSKKQMSPAEKEAREMLAEMKMQAATKRAFDAADSTPPAPATPAPAPRPPMPPMPQRPMPPSAPQGGGMPGMKKGGKVSEAKYMSFTDSGKPAGMKSVTKMASGGSASKRADGIAQKGKTRGKMC